MKITDFKKGDEITRVEQDRKTGSVMFIGDKLVFVGILNGVIHLYAPQPIMTPIGKMPKGKVAIPAIAFEEGWELWKDPNTLYEGIEGIVKEEAKEFTLEKQLENAIKEENYELAAELEKKIKGE